MTKDSEFRSYEYIRKVLTDLGWDTKNPAKGGNLYTQSEFRNHDSLLHDALERSTPENIVCIPWKDGLRYWVVEAKREHGQISKAITEAKKYANTINSKSISMGGGGSLVHHRYCWKP